jgi:membrane protease YdiL (CAAX protease family)
LATDRRANAAALASSASNADSNTAHARRRAWLALLLLVPVPSISILLYRPDESGQVGAFANAFYLFGKVWLIAFPLGWHLFVDRRRATFSPTNLRHLGVGLLVGVVMSLAVIAAYLGLGTAWIDGDALRANLASGGIDTPGEFIALGVGLSIVNAFVEEVVWRWFVVERSAALLPRERAAWSVPIAAACFTLHHVFALAAHFGALVTVLGSLGVFVGGWIWSALYRRTGSIWPSYVSHVIVDAVLMTIGYRLLFG